VVVTSRDELRGLTVFEGATPLRLDVLSPAESLALLGRTVGASRVDADPVAAAELARLCDHLPLALRIAGAHLAGRPDRPVAEYARALAGGNRLGELAIPEDPRAAVRAAFDLSYRALAPHDRLLFRRLGLIPGPDVTAAAAATVAGCPVPDAAAGLARLASAHLVRPLGPDRYGWHDLVRLYAAGQATPGEDAVLAALYAFYLRHVNGAARVLDPHRVRLPVEEESAFADTAAAVAWLDAEFPNLNAAVHHAAATGHQRTACLLADALRGYFPGRGLTPQWLAMAEVALRSAAADPALMTAAHLNFGEIYLSVSGYEQAVAHFDAARETARQADWPDAESTALGNQGAVVKEAGDLRRAVACFTEALAINVRIGNERKQVLDLMNLGVAQAQLGDLRSAADLFARAADLGAAAPTITAMVHQCLGITERLLGRLDTATEHLTDALTVFEEHGQLSGQASVMDSLAGVHADADRRAEATTLATDALRLARQTDARRVETAALNTLGQVASEPSAALAHHEEALRVATEIGFVAGRIEALIGMAGALGSIEEAARLGREALTLARETEHRMLEGQALTAIAIATSDAAMAAAALAIHRETGYRQGITRTERLLL
jgi:tetratricopeptide (TPR) repeat protein